jgi:hypothetical protein
MRYLTFVSVGGRWCLREDLRGAVITYRDAAPRVQDIGAAVTPVLWLSCDDGAVYRLTLPALASPERVPWDGERIGALACSPDGTRALVVEHDGGAPRLRMWDGSAWQHVTVGVPPDVSSKVAWVDDTRIAFESSNRRLVVLDTVTGAEEEGPPGCCPAAAPSAARWYAIADGRPVTFPTRDAFAGSAAPVEDFRIRRPTSLSVTTDGEVCAWTEPRALYRVRAYVQRRGGRRRRFRERERGVAAVIGPYDVG